MKKTFSILLIGLILTLGFAYGEETENNPVDVDNQETNETDVKVKEESESQDDSEVVPDDDEENTDEVISSTEEEIENNFVSKEYEVDGKDKDNYLVEGGNEKAVNTLATKQHNANGTVIESVNASGLPYDLTMLTEEEKEAMKGLELRQFISFETKSGKVFHLIIDHSKSSDNVQMLTEVSEQDLLNLIEENAEVEFILNETATEEEPKSTRTRTVTISNDSTTQIEQVPLNINLIVMVAASIITFIAGWYFKIYKPRKQLAYEDDVDEADYIDEEDTINEDDEE
ncbi:DUF4366 domain-containing protein [Acidaminobacter sp. JC074]|uniref:CD1107 family mobile element protein n=1 Tax=Acidaminobacter sp. JC074 TaxID=2530199 RepID=UPI001F0EE663|nr:DUF4366 domain-containing protein [Acidaminobacter sp. JC074]MCH4888938.1 DUF4366 domain-containing protein [Acidaminobacter sp. JC074]